MCNLKEKFQLAKQEVGEEEFNQHYREVFGKPVLDYVKTIVFNLPEPCYCNCSYCLDKEIIPSVPLWSEDWLRIAKKVMKEFPYVEHITVTGGSIAPYYFNLLMDYIKDLLPEARITWNTNGVKINKYYSTYGINYINLHRQSVRDEKNKRLFRTIHQVLYLDEAKEYFGDKLTVRAVVTKDFDLDEYIGLGLPLFLNRQLPASEVTDDKFNNVLDKLEISDSERRRNNQYLTGEYNGVPVRIGVGDSVYNHIPGREPVFLNVAIVHRSGVVAGTWFEDDKVLFCPLE